MNKYQAGELTRTAVGSKSDPETCIRLIFLNLGSMGEDSLIGSSTVLCFSLAAVPIDSSIEPLLLNPLDFIFFILMYCPFWELDADIIIGRP